MILLNTALRMYAHSLRSESAPPFLVNAFRRLTHGLGLSPDIPDAFNQLDDLFSSETFRTSKCCVGQLEPSVRTGNTILVSGWLLCLGNKITELHIEDGHNEFDNFLLALPRPDVVRLFPGEAGAANCGFCGAIKSSLLAPSIRLSFQAKLADSKAALGTFPPVNVFMDRGHPFFDMTVNLY